MKIGFGRKGRRGLYVYWPNGMECERWDWLFHTIREFLMTGITPEEWAETFGDEEDAT